MYQGNMLYTLNLPVCYMLIIPQQQQKNNADDCLGDSRHFFFKAFAQTSYNLKRNMNAGLYKIWLAEIKTPSIQEKS